MGAPITREEYEKIKLMSELKTSVITKLSGRNRVTIERIKKSENWKDYCDIKVTSHSQPVKAKNETPAESSCKVAEAPAESICEVAEAPAPKPHLLDDKLLLRIANGMTYNNALMNRVEAKLEAICKALGV